MGFVPFDASKYDFSHAPLYRKWVNLKQSQIEIATETQEVVTRFPDKRQEEKRNIAHLGDYIITGEFGERYVIAKDAFPTIYQPDPDAPGTYMSVPLRKALRLTEDTIIPTASGGDMYIEKGGMVVLEADGQHVYGIKKEPFERTYGRADAQGKMFVPLSAPLQVQLSEARTNNAPEHRADILECIQAAGRGKIELGG
jgi:hypothetical protein